MDQSRSSWNCVHMILPVIMLSIIAAGCSAGLSEPPLSTVTRETPRRGDGPVEGLEGPEWVLTKMGSVDAPVTPSGTITAAFGNGEVGGNAGCNDYGGQYQIDGDTITITNLASTLIACADEQMTEQESKYLRALATASTFNIDGNRLILMHENGEMHFTAGATGSETDGT